MLDRKHNEITDNEMPQHIYTYLKANKKKYILPSLNWVELMIINAIVFCILFRQTVRALIAMQNRNTDIAIERKCKAFAILVKCIRELELKTANCYGKITVQFYVFAKIVIENWQFPYLFEMAGHKLRFALWAFSFRRQKKKKIWFAAMNWLNH